MSEEHNQEVEVEEVEGGSADEEHQTVAGNLLDSRTSYLDDVLNEKLSRAFHQPTSQVVVHELVKIVSEHDAIDLAYAVTRLPSAARPIVFENLPDTEAKISFLINSGTSTRVSILRSISNAEIAALCEKMPPDEAVALIEELPRRRIRTVIDLLETEKAVRIRELQRHDVHSAGRLMTNEFFAFSTDTSIQQVSRTIRDNPGIDLARWVFVLSEDRELVGYVPARNLIVNPPDWPLKQVMRPILHMVHPEASRDEVVDLVERYKIPALPVVDEQNRLVGVVAYEDVVEVMEDIADETIASIAGTAEDFSEHDPLFWRFLWRAPWLVVTLCAGLATATVLSHVQDFVWFSFLPLFVPLITGMSGNVGIQSSTLLVRSLSTGELSKGAQGDAVVNEISIGLVTGVIFGVVCGVVVFALHGAGVYHFDQGPEKVAAIVCAGVLGACFTSSFLGCTAPLFFARLRIDPAIAAGPIVTAFNDVLSTIIFILIAWGTSEILFY